MDAETDLLVVGGGINGAGIARDAAGRGLRVVLVEQGDLASATSSASSKLIHGGLRYLEHLELRLVAEALAEREVLLRTAPHIVRPMRFVMPHARGMRPAWMIRTGLFLYDRLAQRQTLAPSSAVDLTRAPYRATLQAQYVTGYAYSDCWADDARLVIANARAAAHLGARILPRTTCVAAERSGSSWRARVRDTEGETEILTRALVNATGAWTRRFMVEATSEAAAPGVKLVQGSHIVVSRLYEGEHAFIIQNDDRRVVFVYPYENDYTLIGTTDVEMEGGARTCSATAQEIDYLCRAANRYFSHQIGPSDVRWSFCGVRTLIDEAGRKASELSRDYLLHIDAPNQAAPILSVFGGKITTYRRLAERALERLARWFPQMGKPWTAGAPLPGGDIAGAHVATWLDDFAAQYPELPGELLSALVRRHGTLAGEVLGIVRRLDDLGEHFGGGLYAREIDYFIAHEWAREGEDVLWRRTKAGLHLSPEQQRRVESYVTESMRVPVAASK